MQVSTASNIVTPAPIGQKAPVPATPAPAPATPAEDVVSLNREASLLAQLESKPDIRPEVVSRGLALAADRSYPPPAVIDALSQLVAGGS